MKTALKIILAVLFLVIVALAFLMFFYPDEQLQDLTELTPSIQNVSENNNSYSYLEEARENYKEYKYKPKEIISFLTEGNKIDRTNSSEQKVITKEDVDQFLESEAKTIELVEKAYQLGYYKNPQEDSYQIMAFENTLPKVYANLIETIFIKGISEFNRGETDKGLLTVIQAMELTAKIRKGSLSIVEYLVNHKLIEEGTDIITYFENNGGVITEELKSRIEKLKDINFQDYVNALKFEFQMGKNSIENLAKTGSLFKQNRFNLRKNATVNFMAREIIKNYIDLPNNVDCNQTISILGDRWESPSNDFFKENGVGQIFMISIAISPEAIVEIFCPESTNTI